MEKVGNAEQEPFAEGSSGVNMGKVLFLKTTLTQERNGERREEQAAADSGMTFHDDPTFGAMTIRTVPERLGDGGTVPGVST